MKMIRGDKLEILYQDDRLVAVAKPAGLATAPGRDTDDCVIARLGRQLGIASDGKSDPRLRLVHRLDKGTSGVLLLAKDRATQRFLCGQFQSHSARKEYLAIVAARPAQTQGLIDAPIAPHPTDPKRMAAGSGRPAQTEWKLEQRLGPFSLLRCFPRTGRTHQIRVHLASAGMGLAVDPLYGPRKGTGIFLSKYKADYRPTFGQEERPLIGRLTLHAARLMFVHPDGREMVVECAAPKDFRAAVKQLGRVGGRE